MENIELAKDLLNDLEKVKEIAGKNLLFTDEDGQIQSVLHEVGKEVYFAKCHLGKLMKIEDNSFYNLDSARIHITEEAIEKAKMAIDSIEEIEEGRAIVNKIIQRSITLGYEYKNTIVNERFANFRQALQNIEFYFHDQLSRIEKNNDASKIVDEEPDPSRTVVVEDHGPQHQFVNPEHPIGEGAPIFMTETEIKEKFPEEAAELFDKKKEDSGAGLETASNELLKSEEAPVLERDEELRNDKIGDSFKSNQNENPEETH